MSNQIETTPEPKLIYNLVLGELKNKKEKVLHKGPFLAVSTKDGDLVAFMAFYTAQEFLKILPLEGSSLLEFARQSKRFPFVELHYNANSLEPMVGIPCDERAIKAHGLPLPE